MFENPAGLLEGVDMMDDTKKDIYEMHKDLLVADAHCDTILQVVRGKVKLSRLSDQGHIDIVRLREGGVKVQFFAAFIESLYKPHNSLTRALQLIDAFRGEIEECSDLIAHCTCMRQIRKDLKDEKIIAILGIEGGEALNGDLAVLRTLYDLGVRFIGLTWNQRNQIADGVGERCTRGGLTQFGRQVVAEMNRLGMIIDLAHISEPGFWDVLELSRHPIMVSHANCQSLCGHPRNLNDDQIKALAEKGGVLGLSFVPDFLGGGTTSMDDFLNHLDHVAGLVGTGVIALGSDFDGIDTTPAGMEDCRCYPVITARLLERGYTENEIRDIMGENLFRLMEKVFSN